MFFIDRLITSVDTALRSINGITVQRRSNPGDEIPEAPLSDQERRHSAGLMRINHVGEVCAQGLYAAQAQFARNPQIRLTLSRAAQEEGDHLAWTAKRLNELSSRPSLLNPLWFGGAFALGTVAALVGDKVSLGFVVETERQVEMHLDGHLSRLPHADLRSRAIVEQMKADEIAHGGSAKAMGADEMPYIIKKAMRSMARVMTSTAYYV